MNYIITLLLWHSCFAQQMAEDEVLQAYQPSPQLYNNCYKYEIPKQYKDKPLDSETPNLYESEEHHRNYYYSPKGYYTITHDNQNKRFIIKY
jgi:hypothetical protein